MNENLPLLKRLHLHFEFSRISSAATFMGNEDWEICDDSCHSLWHYLSRNEGVSHCSFKTKNQRPTGPRMNLEMLTISVGNVLDINDPESTRRYYGKTWIVAAANPIGKCVNIQCPEMDTADRGFHEDGEHTDDHSDRLEDLKSFAREPPKDGVWTFVGRYRRTRCFQYRKEPQPATRARTPL